MAKTLLNGCNEVLKRVNMIQGDSGSLTSLTDSGRQVYIDLTVQLWNEVMESMYSMSNIPLPLELTSDSITLAASDRDYSLASDLVQLHFPLIDTTNGQYINEYPGGYLQLIEDQPFPSNYTGLPRLGAISPVDGTLYLDFIPTSDEAGRVYTYQYDKDVSVSAAADTFPFTDAVFRALVPAVAERWKQERQQMFNEATYRKAMSTAVRLLSRKQQNNTWGPRRISNVGDGEAYLRPFN